MLHPILEHQRKRKRTMTWTLELNKFVLGSPGRKADSNRYDSIFNCQNSNAVRILILLVIIIGPSLA